MSGGCVRLSESKQGNEDARYVHVSAAELSTLCKLIKLERVAPARGSLSW